MAVEAVMAAGREAAAMWAALRVVTGQPVAEVATLQNRCIPRPPAKHGAALVRLALPF